MKSKAAAFLVFGVSLIAARPSAVCAQELLKEPITPFKQHLLQQLRDKHFAELEKLESELRSSKSRFPGGDWKLHHFYDALSGGLILKNAAIDSDWTELLSLQKEWRTASPKSAVPSLLLAQTYTGFAWDARTGAENPSQHRLDTFKDRLNQGAFYLNESRRLLNGNPQWFTTALLIARGLGWKQDQTQTLFDEAMAVDPLYQHTYAMMAFYLLPRWYGEPGEWERFAADSTARVGGQQGFAIYHHIIVRISHLHASDEMFRDNALNWRRIQWSFADRERLYGESKEAVNTMCWLAAAAGDMAAARDFMARVGESWDPSVWRTRQKFDAFQTWLKTAE